MKTTAPRAGSHRESDEVYFSLDVETDGPIPGEYSLLSIGLALCGKYNGSSFVRTDLTQHTFYAELKPVGVRAPQAKALEVNRLDRAGLIKSGEEPALAMRRLAQWVITNSGDAKPVVVSHPAAFDWMWLHWYLVKYLESSPFGFAGSLDMKTLWSAMSKLPIRDASISSYPSAYRGRRNHTHNALDDALEIGEIFQNLYSSLRSDNVPEGRVSIMHVEENGDTTYPVFDRRAAFSRGRLTSLVSAAVPLEAPLVKDQACIYATGSLGRLEANQHSDLDVFILDGLGGGPALGRIRTAETITDLHRAALAEKFDAFTDDGRFLEIHHLPEMLKETGTAQDDARNYFTARLLLLLEGRPVVNADGFVTAQKLFVEAYFRDFLRHRADFKPVFLLNDITRFWKTLALNYESRRNSLVGRLGGDPATEQPREWAKLSSKNLKLKFSRLLTCFSSVVAITSSHIEGTLSPERAVEIFTLTPIERLQRVLDTESRAELAIQQALKEYSWFLEWTELGVAAQLELLEDVEYRKEAFNVHAVRFGSAIYSAVRSVDPDEELVRYLIV